MTPDAVPDRSEIPMSDPQPQPDRPSWFRPMTLLLGLAVAAAAAAFPLLDEQYRPFNFAAFGALGLFVAARVGLFPALLLCLGAKLGSDLLNYRHHGFDAAYLPDPVVHACFAVYAVLGWALLRRTESPWKICGVAVLGSVVFFLTTNFAVWLDPALGYDRTPAGLLRSYQMAIPFYRGTFVGDLAFTGVLFGLHAVLSRAYFPAERVVPQPALQPEVVR
jgi:hypothetical protein